MITERAPHRVLVVSGTEKIYDYLSDVLPRSDFELTMMVGSAGEARRIFIDNTADIVIINTPLPDEFGSELAVSLSSGACGVLLLVKAECFDQICCEVESDGVLTLAKPVSRQSVYSAVRLLCAMNARLGRLEKEKRTLQEKMADIRIVNRAKWLLIEHLSMNEKDAHYYIEKQAMDTRLSRKEVAENIIRTYDK